MNGWHRLGLVIFTIWACIALVNVWNYFTTSAKSHADFTQSMCEFDNEKLSTKTDCVALKESSYKEGLYNALTDEWWAIPAIILSPPIFILILWAISFIFIKITYWILKGFGKLETTKPPLKYSIYLTIFVLVSLIALITIYAAKESKREKTFTIALANCKIELMKSKINDIDETKYLKSCMQTKGYIRKFEKFCFDDISTEHYFCYER